MPAMPASRRILLCVSGMSPAIITETLYALHQQTPPFVPDEVHVVTTLGGLQRVQTDLLDPASGHFHRFMRDYLPGQSIRFDTSTIHPITLRTPRAAPGGINPFGQLMRGVDLPADGREMDEVQPEDIVTEAESRAAGDTIYRVMRQLKEVPGTLLHASVAGGRKSMTFYIGHAFSLLAEPQDKLSHVLVSEPYERAAGFFYPTPRCCMLPVRTDPNARGSQTVDASQAQVTLAELSVLRLGALFGQYWPSKARQSFDVAVRLAQDALVAPVMRVVLDSSGAGHLKVSGEHIALSAKQFAVFAVFALARQHAHELPDGAAVRLEDLSDSFWTIVATDLAGDRIGPGMKFTNVLTKISTELQANIGPVAAHFKIEIMGKSSRDGGPPRMHELLAASQCIQSSLPGSWWNALRKELT
jgi:CRISPR-associated protein (TIGR02584 family)